MLHLYLIAAEGQEVLNPLILVMETGEKARQEGNGAEEAT